MFSSFQPPSQTTVYNNVRLPLLYSDIKEAEWDKRVKQAVKVVGLEPSAAFLRQLSGEKQRVAIAGSGHRTTDNFADEPTGNLDSKSGQVVMDILHGSTATRAHGHLLLMKRIRRDGSAHYSDT